MPDTTQHLILCDHGKIGRAFAERDPNAGGRKSTVDDIVAGQVECVVQVIALDVGEGWCRDVSADIAAECAKRVRDAQYRYGANGITLPDGLWDFIDKHCGSRVLLEAAE